MIGRQRVCTALASAGLAMMGAGPATAQDSASAEGAAFSATVVVTHGIVDAKGVMVRELPSARYRLVQQSNGQLRMVALAGADASNAGPLANRFAGVSVQANPETGRIEIRDGKGAAVELPSVADGAWVESAREPEAFVATRAGRPARQVALERAFGRSQGLLGGKDRYLERSGTRTRELLVSPDSALPSELNVVENGALVERHTFEYSRTRQGDWVRRRTSSETLIPGASGQRMVAVTTFDDVHVGAGGTR